MYVRTTTRIVIFSALEFYTYVGGWQQSAGEQRAETSKANGNYHGGEGPSNWLLGYVSERQTFDDTQHGEL